MFFRITKTGWKLGAAAAVMHFAAQLVLLPFVAATVAPGTSPASTSAVPLFGQWLVFPLPWFAIRQGVDEGYFLYALMLLNSLLWGTAAAWLLTKCRLTGAPAPKSETTTRRRVWPIALAVAIVMLPLVGLAVDHKIFGEWLSWKREFEANDPSLGDADMPRIGRMTNLERLSLVDTKITDKGLKHLRGLTGLRELVLWNHAITDAGLEHLEGLGQLQELGLDGTKTSSDGLAHLEGMTQLRKLGLTDTNVGDDGLRHLAGLERLEILILTSTQVSDAGLEHLKGLSRLKKLDVRNTDVTAAGAQELKAELPNCKVMY